MIDLRSEKLVTFGQATRSLPRKPNGKRVCTITVSRWASRGHAGVVLETIRVGRQRYTSMEALQRFAERLNSSVPAPRFSSRRDAIEATLELEREGV